MEIPDNIKQLYKHWEFHVDKDFPKAEIGNKELLKEISAFVKERITIWQKKTQGKPTPYTADEVLSKYRFCNILREFDRQTIEFHTILNPIRNDFPLWLMNMFYFRLVARTSTVQETGLLTFENGKEFYKKLMDTPRPRFGTPYVFPVSVIQRSDTPTRELFIAEYLPKVMKDVAREISTWKKESVYDGLKKLIPIFGYNLNFLWTEVLIDVAYQYPEYLDLYKRFPIGPGSMPTMMRIDAKKDPSQLVEELCFLKLNTGLTYENKPILLSAENWEGIGCEFRKYTNLKAGGGRKRLYK